MSYNVGRWTTKELCNLCIPVASLFKHSRTDWHPDRKDDPSTGLTTFTIMESRIIGRVSDGVLHVEEIEASGEGSGTALNYVIEPALADSTGKLVVVRIWERGDSIDRMTVSDGVVKSEEIEL